MYADQSQFQVRFEWGLRGLAAVAQPGDLIVIVDVLSFCTCVDVAAARGASILPYRWKDDSVADFAKQQKALLATSRRSGSGYSLSPSSLLSIESGTRLVLPSPNGATLALAAAEIGTTVAGCLRNAQAVARFARAQNKPVSVIGCGERWENDDSLRPAWEDLVGAGAVIDALSGSCSPDALAAGEAFLGAKAALNERMLQSASGIEMTGRGFPEDVYLAAQYNVSQCVPVMVDGGFVAAQSG